MRPASSRWDWTGGALLLLAASTASVAAEAPQFDGRGWTVGNHQRNARQSLTEYVLPGQTVENWKELVTSTVFSQPIPLAAFMEKLHASMSQGCPSLVWNVIQQDEKTVVFEWRDAGCGGFEPQNELDRVTIEQGRVYRLAYAAKVQGPLAPERRTAWLAILRQIPLAERSVGGPVAGRRADRLGSGQQGGGVGKAAVHRGAGDWSASQRVDLPGGVKSEVRGSRYKGLRDR